MHPRETPREAYDGPRRFFHDFCFLCFPSKVVMNDVDDEDVDHDYDDADLDADDVDDVDDDDCDRLIRTTSWLDLANPHTTLLVRCPQLIMVLP